MIFIDIDLKPLARALRRMSSKQRTMAMRDSLNRAMDGMHVAAKRGIPKQANLYQKDVTAGLSKRPASGSKLEAVVTAKGRWEPASYSKFKARQDGTGASFKPWNERQKVRSGFIATMKSGHTSIFVRVNKSRLPIADVGWGPNLAREMVRLDQPTEKAMREIARERFFKRFKHQYERLVSSVKSVFGL